MSFEWQSQRLLWIGAAIVLAAGAFLCFNLAASILFNSWEWFIAFMGFGIAGLGVGIGLLVIVAVRMALGRS